MSSASKKGEVGYGSLCFQKPQKKCILCSLNGYASGAAPLRNRRYFFKKRPLPGDGPYGKFR
jgi:hypothetical protein